MFWSFPLNSRFPGNYQLGILQDQENLLYNLYPFVHLLPSGNLFIFAGQLSCVLNYWDNTVGGVGPSELRRHAC